MQNIDVWNRTVKVESSAYNWNEDPIIKMPDYQKVRNYEFAIMDLFCGCGGISEGFRKVGFKTALGLDIHIPSIMTFHHNHPEAVTILGDIGKIRVEEIAELVKNENVAVITAGVPCQGFSLLNRKRWEYDERNYLFREFIRVIRHLRPPFVLLENVSGLRTSANGRFMREIAKSIEEIGYAVEFDLLNAADYGVPQARQRVVFLGAQQGLDIRWPRPTHGSFGIVQKNYLTLYDAISDLPTLMPSQKKIDYESPPTTEYQIAMRAECSSLYNHEAPHHSQQTTKRIQSTSPGESMYSSFPQRIRLRWDAPSPTQVAGGIRPQFFYGHPDQPRGLTVRERCRIQSFCDNYFISGGIVQGRVQTGNAVPPTLAAAIAEQISDTLLNRPRSEKALPKKTVQLGLSI